MTVGTIVVSAILAVIIVAIIVYMIRSHRAGKHIGCDGCNGCSEGSSHGAGHKGDAPCGCANVDAMLFRMNEDLKNKSQAR